MTLREWILADLAAIEARLGGQVLAPVPPARRRERPGGGNSIAWSTLHVARHAELAVAILGGPAPMRSGAFGLGEVEPALWPERFDETALERYALATLAAGRELAQTIDIDSLDDVPDATAILERNAVPRDEFGWLYEQWAGQPCSFFIGWPLTAHQTNHIGEMIATRNRLGLSPYAQ